MTNLTFGSVLLSHLMLVDIALFVVFGLIHSLSWPRSLPSTDPVHQDGETRNRAAGNLTTAVTGGITGVGILLPLSLVAIQVIYGSKPSSHASSVGLNLFVADIWLTMSLILGLFVLYAVGAKASSRNILYLRWIGIPFGLQLMALTLGVVRILIAVFVLVNKG
jgi:hypothetical protein